MFFFFNVTAATEIYTLSLHDALPILRAHLHPDAPAWRRDPGPVVVVDAVFGQRPRIGVEIVPGGDLPQPAVRSEEHTSELQSHVNLVCRLLLEKKKKYISLRQELPSY